MPKNTKVHKMAKAMVRAGVPEGIAIATAQKRTDQSYATGKKLNHFAVHHQKTKGKTQGKWQ